MTFRVFPKRFIQHKRSVVCVIILLVFCYSARFSANFARSQTWNKRETITFFHDIHLPQKTVKKIVFWTPFFSHPYNMDAHRKCLSECDFRCDITDDKRDAEDADAIEFHLSDVWRKFWTIGTKSVIEFPETRKPHQVWILFNMEPPVHMWGDLGILNGLFNWTRWYRLDSDIPIPYGSRKEISEKEKAEASKQLRDRNFYREKNKDIYLRISNCYDIGQRYKLVEELDKHFRIDKFGQCYNGTRCDAKGTCSDSVLKQYKFHLAFENDHCKDYLTEKYWESLRRDQIPIVNWKHGVFESAIPGSFINLFDFKDLVTAIRYIREVSNNETLYNSYFWYRTRYKNEAETCSICAVCRALHNMSRHGQVYTDLESWVRDDTCEKIGYWNEITRNVNGFMYYKLGLY